MARAFPSVLDLPRAPSAAGTIRLPGSKSLSNRLLLLAAVARGVSRIENLLESDDTEVMLEALARLGVVVHREADAWIVPGCDGRFPVRQARLFVGNSGLSIRTLVPMVAAALSDGGSGEVVFEGVARMHERPIGDLVDGLRALGADVRYLARPGYPPLSVHAAPLAPAAAVRMRGDVSSQFITGLLQAAPLLTRAAPLRVEVEGELISRPYLEITRALMTRFGVPVGTQGAGAFVVPAHARYRAPAQPVLVEGDASSASYFLALGAIGGGPVRVLGAGRDSVQGDVRFADALEAMGARIRWGSDWIEAARGDLRGVDLDCNAIPDAAMTLAVVALHAQGDTLLRGIGSWRVKETDRIAAMAAELVKLGAAVEAGPDWLRVRPPARLAPGAAIRTYDDHRIAMCFSLASIDGPHRDGVALRILEPGCVAKTFPEYFERFGRLASGHAATAAQSRAEPAAVPVIAIDGPTASGKGTVAQRVAQALGWHYLDSGALYRLLALAASRAGVGPADPDALDALARGLSPTFDGARIRLGDDDVTDEIRAEAVGETASRIAAQPAVRAALVALQHAARRPPGLVADGRDMGTVIFPDAPVKVFLTASAESRAQRRTKQLIEKGFPAKFDDLLRDLQARDARDIGRASSPLVPAADAHVLDSTTLSIDETVEAVLSRWRAAHA